MTAQTPLILVDNVFDNSVLYPSAALSGSAYVTGHEPFRVADYRRDRTWYLPSGNAGNHIKADLGAGITRAIDFFFIDRGHNFWGKTVTLEGGDDNATWPTSADFVVPAQGTVGGDPTWPSVAVTEEGALYSIKSALTTARRYWRFSPNSVTQFIPVVTGLMAGQKSQLLGYSTVFDEDAGGRTEAPDTSAAGYRGSATTYSWRTVELGLGYIGSAEYDGTMRTLRQLLFQLNQPAVVFLDYATYPGRGWMYQYDGASWGMSKQRVYRSGRIRLRELGPALT